MSQLVRIDDYLDAQQEIVIGKDILELLTGAMYVDPLSIYREYVQNAADAIEDAVEAGLYKDVAEGSIHITIDSPKRTVCIRDDGIGISQRTFFQRLTAIGASDKRARVRRGFRGVGRLSGLGYCQELVFRSRSNRNERVSELRWDVRKMRTILRDPKFSGHLADAIRATVSTSTSTADQEPAHFFEVRLEGLVRLKNDVLMDEAAVGNYLSQVAPVPFAKELKFTKDIEAHLSAFDAPPRSFNVLMGSKREAIVRPYTSQFLARSGKDDAFNDVELLSFDGLEGGPAAVGWVLHHSYLGALPPTKGIGGIRLRRDNIQVGTAEIVASLFPESRFNSWVACEIHILDRRILPNGRRDEFEHNAHYYHLQSHLSALALRLAKRCRQVSAVRTRAARASQPIDTALQALRIIKKLDLTPKLAEAALESIRSHLKPVVSEEKSPQQKAVKRILLSINQHDEISRKGKKNITRGEVSRDKAIAHVLNQAVALYGLERGIKLLQRVVVAED